MAKEILVTAANSKHVVLTAVQSDRRPRLTFLQCQSDNLIRKSVLNAHLQRVRNLRRTTVTSVISHRLRLCSLCAVGYIGQQLFSRGETTPVSTGCIQNTESGFP